MNSNNVKIAAFLIAGLTAAASLGAASANPQPAAHRVVVAANDDKTCYINNNAYTKLSSAAEDIRGILNDFKESDSIYPKLKESNRQILDAVASLHSRLQRLHCP